MWNVPVAAGNTHPAFFMAFVLVWSFIGVTYLHFWWRVAPAALRIWAEGEGYGFISQKWAGVMDWISFAGGSGHIVYRVVVRDREGKEQHGLVRVGTPYWFCTSASRCPIKVRWGKFAGTLEGLKNLSDPTRFDWKGEGGGSARGRVATRRTVFCFAVADLILAIPLAALVLGHSWSSAFAPTRFGPVRWG